MSEAAAIEASREGISGLVDDWSADKQTYHVPWGKAMMWIFLVSDTFIFTCFLTGYLNVRMTTTMPWPPQSEIFALVIGGVSIPLILIAIMTFDLITSSGTMALAVNYGYRKDKKRTVLFICLTAFFGAAFVGMQAFEWSKLIFEEDIRPWGNPFGAPQFGSVFFMVTGFHGMHVSIGVLYLLWVANRVRKGYYDDKGYEIVEIAGLYWHFVDLVWVFIFAFFYLL